MRRLAQCLVGVVALGLVGLSPVQANAATGGQLGDLGGVSVDGSTITASSGTARVRISFPNPSSVRVWLAPDGQFDDPAGNKIITNPGTPVTPKRVDHGDYWAFSTPKATLRAYKHPLKFALYDGANQKRIWAESKPLSWTADATTQTLARSANEQFFGGGEQNGRLNHTDQTIKIFADDNWNDGGAPNSQPFYVSTAGYGVLRNTFAPGSYSFTNPVQTTESEHRFDAVYMVGDGLKDVVSRYTDLVGKPFMPPIYGLETGDSDCYLHNANRGERHTTDALKVADGYVANNMPNGWMLVNDGYGCGYENLQQVGEGLRKDNQQLGLWTQDGLPNQADEVKAGVRVRKLDVAWVGDGYQHALDACDTAHKGIEDNSDARGFVWQPVSWAGAQRCSVLWSGDQSGSWNYIKWQIPTYAASTLSGIAYNTGDIDGIFGGSPQTYARDLQWKTFLPAAMTMDGWASSDKQPWRYGEPYTSMNRKYLMLKERLMPYSYSYSAQAHQTGVGQVRPLVMEYPNDPNVYGDKAKYEFLSGTDFLVAPVYSDTTVRNGIYLPAGTWTDYWTGRTYTGPTTVDGYKAPLDTLPLFVRGGAVVPMWAEGTKSWQTRDSGVLDLDVYPQSHGSFTLTEDDGVTRDFQKGAQANQTFTVDAPRSGPGAVSVHIGQSKGNYTGKPTGRRYDLTVHTGSSPAVARAGKSLLTKYNSKAEYDAAATGWWYDAADRGGVVHVKTASVAADKQLDVVLDGTSAVGGWLPQDQNTSVTVDAPGMLTPGQDATATVSFTNRTGVPVRDLGVQLTAPQGFQVTRTGAQTPWLVLPGQTTKSTFKVKANGAAAGNYELDAKATYSARASGLSVEAATQVTLPYGALSATFGNIGSTDAAHVAVGDLDGSGSSFSTEGLAKAGLEPGKPFTALGATLTWPTVAQGQPDNAVAAHQTIAFKGQGSSLVLVGTGTGTAKGTVVVHYADGTTSQADTGFPNWCCADPTKYGATTVAKTLGKNTHAGPAYPTVAYLVFANQIPVTAGKEVVAFTLPDSGAMHVFAATLK